MLIALAFITSVFQFILYYINYKKGNKVHDFLITIIIILIYLLVYPFFSYNSFQEENRYGFPFIFQIMIYGSLGTFSALVTNIIWHFKKKNIE